MEKISEAVLYGSFLGPLFFQIHINDLLEEITCSVKMFIDNKFVFSKKINRKHSGIGLNKCLKMISQWAYQWKMLFNLGPTKLAIVTCFSHKHKNVFHQLLAFNNDKRQFALSQKHLGLVSDSK